MYPKHVVVSMIMVVVVIGIVTLVNDVEQNGGGYSIAQLTVESKSSKINLVDFGHGRYDDAIEE